ncbi:unnamed protein product, partial [Rotaria magnacalcarata]
MNVEVNTTDTTFSISTTQLNQIHYGDSNFSTSRDLKNNKSSIGHGSIVKDKALPIAAIRAHEQRGEQGQVPQSSRHSGYGQVPPGYGQVPPGYGQVPPGY